MNSFFDKFGSRISAEIPKGGTLIDIGCSTGLTTLEMMRRFSANRAVGVDFVDPKQIGLEHPSVAPKPTELESKGFELIQGDMFHLPESIPQADLIVYANNLLPRIIGTKDIKMGSKAIREAIPHLKESGKVILIQNGLGRDDLLFLKNGKNGITPDMTDEELKKCPFNHEELNELVRQINE